MTPKVTDELRQAIKTGGPVRVEDDQTHKFYVIVDEDLHNQAMQALREQKDLAAIQAGVEAVEQGRGKPVEEVDQLIRAEFGFPPRH